MVLARKNAAVDFGLVLFLVLVILALPLQFEPDGLPISTGIFSVKQINLTTILPQQKSRVELGSISDAKNQTPKLNPYFLRIDYKQNLLVWPVLAGDLTRSPPLIVSPALS
ncbi:MAG TPA: hypothetical protein VLJ79_31280 [Candidatus Binatia bacterium]|nr:hypothetical protein [Candidatus Binatia bacterium]